MKPKDVYESLKEPMVIRSAPALTAHEPLVSWEKAAQKHDKPWPAMQTRVIIVFFRSLAIAVRNYSSAGFMVL